jgi:hypothetical protein
MYSCFDFGCEDVKKITQIVFAILSCFTIAVTRLVVFNPVLEVAV